MQPQRYFEGNEIGYKLITRPMWQGGFGYVPTILFRVWNPANPNRYAVLTPPEFEALTAPAPLQLAA